jgi:hypothetical protein
MNMELPEKVVGTDVLYEFLRRRKSRDELSDYVRERAIKKKDSN